MTKFFNLLVVFGTSGVWSFNLLVVFGTPRFWSSEAPGCLGDGFHEPKLSNARTLPFPEQKVA